jgi:apolipoprotein N-acyltransferase
VPDIVGAVRGIPRRGPAGLRVAAAVLSGALLVVAFPPYGLWPLAPVAVAGLTLAVHGATVRLGALLGLGFGLTFFLGLMTWMRVIGSDAWFGLSLLEAAFLAALGAGTAAVVRLPAWPLWAATLWVGSELLRARIPFGGLPWGRLAFSQEASPFTPYAALAGAPLVTFAVALTGTLLGYAVLRALPAPGPALAALAALAAVAAAGLAVPVETGADRRVTVAAVQGNVPRSGLDFLGQREAVLRNHVAATRTLAAQVRAGRTPRPDLVVWPENSSDIDPFSDPRARRLIDEAVREIGVPTLIGTLVAGPDAAHVRNVGVVWDPVTGPGASYTKRHPVPFGEYIPFRSTLTRFISRLERIPRDFYPGSRPGVLTVGPARLGDVICFEIAYDGLVRDVVDGGGQMIVVQTNNATYGRTGQPEQQLAISRLRAVEHGRAVVIPATSGISAIITPDGTLVDRSQEFTTDLLVRSVAVRDGRTVAGRVGAAPEWFLGAAGGAALALCAGRARGRRLRGGPRPAPPAAAESPQLTSTTQTAGKVAT